jgi:hypothetical protein
MQGGRKSQPTHRRKPVVCQAENSDVAGPEFLHVPQPYTTTMHHNSTLKMKVCVVVRTRCSGTCGGDNRVRVEAGVPGGGEVEEGGWGGGGSRGHRRHKSHTPTTARCQCCCRRQSTRRGLGETPDLPVSTRERVLLVNTHSCLRLHAHPYALARKMHLSMHMFACVCVMPLFACVRVQCWHAHQGPNVVAGHVQRHGGHRAVCGQGQGRQPVVPQANDPQLGQFDEA